MSIEKIYKEILFEKHILVNDSFSFETDKAEILLTFSKLFNIRITKGPGLVHHDMIPFISEMLGVNVPEPFYRSFPRGVRELSSTQLLYDQLINYFITYDLGDMSVARRSVMEPELEREAFRETGSIREFEIVVPKEALRIIGDIASDLISGTRPLNDKQIEFIVKYIKTNGWKPANIASKNTALRILLETRWMYFVKFIELSDVIKLVEEINFRLYDSTDIKKLNLKNTDRRFIAQVIDKIVDESRANVEDCYEKQKNWTGLLHHIHYKPSSDAGKEFASLMRSGVNKSAYSLFEKEMGAGDIRKAVTVLKEKKGAGAVLRELDRIVSRCSDEDEIRFVLDNIETDNTLLLLQLYLHYLRSTDGKRPRSFSFAKFGLLKQHYETAEEMERRKSFLSYDRLELLKSSIYEMIKTKLNGKLGKVYIDPDMARYALPLQESTAQSGFGVLAKGSRLPIGDMHKIRGFTYWEKVDDIDLSVIGLDDAGRQYEFSWRTMAGKQSPAITYSGDMTSGYDGGSEYFDIDIEKFRKEYPDVRYIVFCDNVFSRLTFDKCICRAGYMVRDKEDSGEIFEAKTVQSSFSVDCKSTFCYLFAVDLERSEFVWLNCARGSMTPVAGTESLWFLTDVIRVTDLINVKWFFELLAAEVCDDISSADVVVSDKNMDLPDGVSLIREYDLEKMIRLMNP